VNLTRIEDYNLGGKPWASLILLRVFLDKIEGMDPKEAQKQHLHWPIGFVFVEDPKYGPRTKVKLPGGRKDPADLTPAHTARRECWEETGIEIGLNELHLGDQYLREYDHCKVDFEDHYKVYFYADIYERQQRMMHDLDPRNEGERPKFYTLEETQQKIDQSLFLMEHLDSLIRAGLLFPPLGIQAA
jgi:8-oxo-dGTP pyrophosphatase MutT (NUDIX family)